LQHPLRQTRFVIARLRFVTLRAPWLFEHGTRPALRNVEGLLQILHGRSLSRRAY
jgi:hypothetical protein